MGTTSATQSFTISNSGSSTVNVSSVSAPSGFNVSNWTGGNIASGETKTVNVTFSPTDATAYSGTIVVNSDAGSEGNTVSVTGTGVEGGSVPVAENTGGHLLGNPSANGTAMPIAGFGVNAVTGNFFHQETDAAMPGKDIPFVFARAYNSLSDNKDSFGSDQPQPLGSGWTHTYNIVLRTDGTEDNAEVIWGDGRRDGFVRSGTLWQGSTPGSFATLTKPGTSSYTWEVTTRDQIRFRFDSSKRLAAIVGRSDHGLSLSYNGNGELATITDTAGRIISFAYSGNRLTQVSLPPSRSFRFSYTADGLLKSVTDMQGNIRQYVYMDGMIRQLHWAASAAYPMLQLSYDSQARVREQETGHTLSNGESGSYLFDWTTPNQMKYNDPLGNWITYVWDDQKRVTQITPTNGKTNNVEYFTADGPESLLTQNVEDYEDNAYGTIFTGSNLTQLKLPDGRQYSMDYNAANDPVSVSTPQGLGLSIERIASGKPKNMTASGTGITGAISISVSYKTGDLVDQISNPGNTQSGTKIEIESYTADGQPKEVRNYTDSTNYLSTFYEYDTAGRRVSEKDHRGTLTCYYYDDNDNITDVVSGLTGSCSQAPASSTVRHTRFEYDADERLKSVTEGYGGSSPQTVEHSYETNTGALFKTCVNGHRCVRYAYDNDLQLRKIAHPTGREDLLYRLASGRIQIERANANGSQGTLDRIERRGYDGNGELLTVSSCTLMDDASEPTSDCQGSVRTQYTRDNLGRVTRVREFLELGGESRITTYSYSSDGRIITVGHDGDSSTGVYETDALGRLIRVTQNKGSESYTATAEYDSDGRLTKVTDPQGLETVYTYDGLGRMLSQEDIRGKVQWTYNDTAGTIRRTEPDGSTVDYSFDRLGQVTRMGVSDGQIFTFVYDSRGRLTKETWTGNGNTGERTYAYNEFDELTGVTGPFGKTVSYTRDDAGRITARNLGGSNINYAYDAFDRIRTMNTSAGNFSFAYQFFTHALGRVGFPNGVETTYERNELGELVHLTTGKSGTGKIADYQITLDALGRRSSIQSEQPVAPAFVEENLLFGFEPGGMLSTLNGASVLHDGRGNLTDLPAPTEGDFGYDVLNRLVSAGTTQHGYDAARNRIQSTRDGETTRYLLDVANGLPDVAATMDENNNVEEMFIHGPGGLLAWVRGGVSRYVHQDFNYNVVALTDESGTVKGSFAYTPFGKSACRHGETDIPFQFAGGVGAMSDPEGLIYMRARYYHPGIRQFTSADLVPGMLGRPQSLGRYAYVEGMALGGVDPSGLFLDFSDWLLESNSNYLKLQDELANQKIILRAMEKQNIDPRGRRELDMMLRGSMRNADLYSTLLLNDAELASEGAKLFTENVKRFECMLSLVTTGGGSKWLDLSKNIEEYAELVMDIQDSEKNTWQVLYKFAAKKGVGSVAKKFKKNYVKAYPDEKDTEWVGNIIEKYTNKMGGIFVFIPEVLMFQDSVRKEMAQQSDNPLGGAVDFL